MLSGGYMDKKKRPTGRRKRVGSGLGTVKKRGSGVGRKTGGLVGSSSGYKRRKTTSRPRPAVNSGGRKLSFKTIIIIGVILFAVYMFLNGGFGGGDSGITMPELGDIASEPQGTYAPEAQMDNEIGVLDKSVSSSAKAKRTEIVGGGRDEVTLMIYMIGTDLESRSGMATADLQEMTGASISDQVTVIVQTGGTKKWQNSVISNKTNQRYQVTSEGLKILEDNLGKKSMVDPDTLSDFIRYSEENFPADRYQLILWDHGGGSLTGYGFDEHFPGEHMTLDEIDEALKDGKTDFDFIGFDACLMATLETALVVAPYADYMIASEELEPGIGWYYTDWLSALSDNTSISTLDLGATIINTYVKEVESKTPKSQATLSLIDLAELEATVPDALGEFAQATNALIDAKDYKVVSNARAGAKEFAKSSKINQIDLIDFAEDIGTIEANNLAKVLRSAVKYNRTSSNISHANGVSIYFPYDRLNQVGDMVDTYEEIGMDASYTDVIKSFGSLAAGGQIVAQNSGTGGNLLGSLLGQSGGASGLGSQAIGQLLSSTLSGGGGNILGSLLGGNNDWVDQETVTESAEYYAENQLSGDSLKITTKDGQKVLVLTEKQWDLIQTMEQNVFIDDGEGFIDLGLDNVYEWNDDGDLVMDFDGTWLAMNGNIVSYYMISEDTRGDNTTIMGRVPAFLNEEKVDIILQFDDSDPYGTVLGATLNYDENTETSTFAKGLISIEQGDQINFLCDYYSYEGDYDDTYYLGDTYTVSGKWQIENLDISQYEYQMAYRITDIYNNKIWTPTVTD